jgi:outer membrane lipoprotein-sorting protein
MLFHSTHSTGFCDTPKATVATGGIASPETTVATDALDTPSALDIVKKMNELLRGTSTYSRIEMQIVTPRWKRAMLMDSWAMGLDYYFIHIIGPPREANTTFLKRKRLLHQYLPSAEMRIKISPSMMMQSWMGSDFTNDDLVKESSVVEDYNHKLLGTETMDDINAYKIELLPKPDAPVVWDKILIWVNPETYSPLQEDFFDSHGMKIRTMKFSHYKEVDGRSYPMVQTLTPLNKEGHSTTKITRDIRFDIPIDPNVFTIKNLEAPRK